MVANQLHRRRTEKYVYYYQENEISHIRAFDVVGTCVAGFGLETEISPDYI